MTMSRMRGGFFSLLAAGLLCLTACSLLTLVLDESDSGTIRSMDVGELLRIELDGNASTGYEWIRTQPASLEGSPLVSEKEGDYQPLGVQPVGGPGTFCFRYRAMQTGTVTLAFEYRRPWEPDDPIDTYTVTIWVTN